MGFWQFATGGGSGGGTGDVVGPASSTDNAVARWDLATGKLLQNSDLTVSDLAAGAITITAGKGTAITLKNTDPDATTGASVAGDPLTITAGNAVASTDTAGAASGGAVTITSGAAARNTSGNANGGDINLTTGAGIGTGTTGKVVIPSAAGLNWSTDTGLARSAAGVVKVTDGSTGAGGLIVKDGTKTAASLSFVTGGVDTGLFQRVDNYVMVAAAGKEIAYFNNGSGGSTASLNVASGISFHGGELDSVAASSGIGRYADSVAIITNGGQFNNTIGALHTKVDVEANTAGSGSPNVLINVESGMVLTNEGSGAKNYHTLPTAVAGYQFTFIVQDVDGMRIVANTDDTIRVIDKVTAAAGYIESTTIGSTVTLVSINAVEWYAVAITGVWTDGTWSYDDTALTTP